MALPEKIVCISSVEDEMAEGWAPDEVSDKVSDRLESDLEVSNN